MDTTRRALLHAAGALATTSMLPSAFAQAPRTFRFGVSAAVPRPYTGYVFLGDIFGFSKRLGFTGDTTFTTGSGAAIQLMLANRVDATLPGILEFVAIKKTNPSMKARLVYCQNYALSYLLVVPEDGPIQSVADLKGKTIGVLSLGSGAVQTVKAQLRQAGVDPSTVQIVAVGTEGAAYAAIRNKQVDGLGLFIGTIASIENMGAKFRSFSVPVPSGAVAVTDDFLAKNRDLLINALQVMALNTAVMQLNPKLVVEATHKLYGPPTGDREAAMRGDIRTVEATAKIFKHPTDRRKWGELTEAGWNQLIEFVGGDSGYTVDNTRYADYFDPSLIEAVNKVDMSLAMDVVKNGLPS